MVAAVKPGVSSADLWEIVGSFAPNATIIDQPKTWPAAQSGWRWTKPCRAATLMI